MYDNPRVSPPPPIGTQIRHLRTERGLTLAELARLAETSAPTMHRYEGGWNRFEVSTLQRIAAALGAVVEVRLIPNPEPPACMEARPEEIVTLVAPLFWDHELRVDDLDRHPGWILARILMFGSAAQVRAARWYYGDSAILEAIGRREVDSRTRNYWELILEETCIRRS